jgi:hypothetical protein
MLEREVARLLAGATETDAIDIRLVLRREIETFAWSLVSRLAGEAADAEAAVDKIPLDRTLARG